MKGEEEGKRQEDVVHNYVDAEWRTRYVKLLVQIFTHPLLGSGCYNRIPRVVWSIEYRVDAHTTRGSLVPCGVEAKEVGHCPEGGNDDRTWETVRENKLNSRRDQVGDRDRDRNGDAKRKASALSSLGSDQQNAEE
ncbi:hypothetical protein KQX54_007857 [Cotesia glomerata]|uniref:Uncharacterized protein n=1 Tax=Cotesia glomerata TaxID=32391 RepID=A0AAV7HZM6_COTGL|nr:hypothetical protein KQX54_007857 [Cotesia glomerata]